MIKNIIFSVHIFLSVVLTLLIFLQTSSDSESRNNILSSTSFEKRGWEKTMFYLTIFILLVFLLSSVIQTFI